MTDNPYLDAIKDMMQPHGITGIKFADPNTGEVTSEYSWAPTVKVTHRERFCTELRNQINNLLLDCLVVISKEK